MFCVAVTSHLPFHDEATLLHLEWRKTVAMVTPRRSSYLINFSLVFLVACLLISAASLSGSKDAPRDLHKYIRERAAKDGFESGAKWCVWQWEDVIFSPRTVIVNSEWILSVRNDKFLDEILSQSLLVGTNKDELCTTLTKPITSATHAVDAVCNWHINNETPIFPRHFPAFYCGYMLIWCRISSLV